MPVTPREGWGTSGPHRGPAKQHTGSRLSGVLPGWVPLWACPHVCHGALGTSKAGLGQPFPAPWTAKHRGRAGEAPRPRPAEHREAWGWHSGWWSWDTHLQTFLSEPAFWIPAEKVQEQQRLAETLGGLHQFLLVLLQNPSGRRGPTCGRCTLTEPPVGGQGLGTCQVTMARHLPGRPPTGQPPAAGLQREPP